MNYFERVFSRILATDKGTNTIQNICRTKQPFLSKITTDCLWNFSFLEVCIHLISSFTCKDTIFKRISSSCYGAIVHKCSKKGCFLRYWRNLQETPILKYSFRLYGVIWLIYLQTSDPNVLSDIRPNG